MHSLDMEFRREKKKNVKFTDPSAADGIWSRMLTPALPRETYIYNNDF